MANRAALIACTLAASMFLLATPDGAAAGEYTVGVCQSDRLHYNTRSFSQFATVGMMIRRACSPYGRGMRGLITANVVRRRSLPRGSVSRVMLAAPPGTRFATFRWAGTARRTDCRYALQIWADAPDIDPPIPIKNVRANQHCPRKSRAQVAGYRTHTFGVNGATQIVQRVICIGGHGTKSCSARARNYIRTYKAEVRIVDNVLPTVSIRPGSDLASGRWVGGGLDAIVYYASDNVGVRTAQAVANGLPVGTDTRPCALASPAGPYADLVPCPNGLGLIHVDTETLAEGTQALAVQAQDAAGNVGRSAPVTVRIDRTDPGRVDVAVEGGERWRSQNSYTLSWVNPPEPDRAPITGARYKLCPAGPGSCIQGSAGDTGISHLTVQVPGQGQWRLSLWRVDDAGNESEAAASVPVTLRYDAEPPQLVFERQSTSDPTLISVSVTDRVSGVADGVIEISRQGSNSWQALATQRSGSRLVARVDDAVLPPGAYALRARAHDQAGNEASTTQRVDGQAMTIGLPLRIRSLMNAGVMRTLVVRRTVRRGGKRRHVHRRVSVLTPSARVGLGRHVQILGRLTTSGGQSVPNAEVQVFSHVLSSSDQLVGVVQTDGGGQFNYVAAGTMSRTLRFAYGGSPLILPTQREVGLRVPAASSIHVNRRRLHNGQTVRFTGTVRSAPVPAAGKLVEMQVRFPGRWRTFSTTRTDGKGRWLSRYRFTRTGGVQHYHFRARLPREIGYPFEPGATRALTVRVRGR